MPILHPSLPEEGPHPTPMVSMFAQGSPKGGREVAVQNSVVVDPPPPCSLGTAANHLALHVTEVILAVVVAGIAHADCLVGHCFLGGCETCKESTGAVRFVSVSFLDAGYLVTKLTLRWGKERAESML